MRTFIAIELPEEARDKLAKLQDRLRKPGADIKWVKPSNIHLTLKFLGKIDEALLPDIKSSLTNLANTHKTFNIALKGVGAFPKLEYPRVIWVSIDKGKQESASLSSDIENAMCVLGFEKEVRPFRAHLTLGRVRTGKNKPELIEAITKEKDFTVTDKIPANKITLIESQLTSEGPIYTPLAKFPLP